MIGALRWLPALSVALGAAAATAHGLFEVAVASRVPAGIAWLYPAITDGLALVAYASTRRLSGGPAGYAWAVVVLAAVLSGLGQAVYLASDDLRAVTAVRFGVGFWPAIACALVAHLLHLVYAAATSTTGREPLVPGPAASQSPVRVELPPALASEPEPRVADLARRLAEGEELNGPAVALELGVSDRTGRRLLGDARAHIEQHHPLHLVTNQEPPA